MAERKGSLSLGTLIGLMVGNVLNSLFSGLRRKKRYFASTEYWVYIPGVELPAQEQIMHRMLAANPHNRPGIPAVGHREGILFSDIRTHIALVLRSKNPHVFRPEQLTDAISLTNEQREELQRCTGMVKVRYISEEPLPDKRHLTFVTHAAEAIAELAGGSLVYDLGAEKVLSRSELYDFLEKDPTGHSTDLHLNLVWGKTIDGGFAETRGLEKIGANNLRTHEMENDERVIVSQVLESAAAAAWDQGAIPEAMEVNAFDDLFRVTTVGEKDRKSSVRIVRVQAN